MRVHPDAQEESRKGESELEGVVVEGVACCPASGRSVFCSQTRTRTRLRSRRWMAPTRTTHTHTHTCRLLLARTRVSASASLTTSTAFALTLSLSFSFSFSYSSSHSSTSSYLQQYHFWSSCIPDALRHHLTHQVAGIAARPLQLASAIAHVLT